MQKLTEHRLTQAEAAEKLEISIRQVQRLVKSYRESNYQGLISKKRGKAGNHTISIEIKAKILDIIIKHYSDFGPTLAREKLIYNHDCQ